MKDFELTETKFFKRIGSGNDISHEDMQVHFEQFVANTMTLCRSNGNVNAALGTLAFADTELSFCVYSTNSVVAFFVTFIRKMMKFLTCHPHHHVAHISNIGHNIEAPPASPPTMCWTGKASDLVELIYGIVETKSINNGETPLKEVAKYTYDMFGVKAKNCYQIYNDMNLRKNDSRTYYLDSMSDLVNRRMEMDEELERARR